MNRFIASIFSVLLTILHVVVLLIVGIAIYLDFSQPGNAPTYTTIGMLIFLVIYIVFIGFVSVVVSMGEDIAEIRKSLDKGIRSLDRLNANSTQISENNDPKYPKIRI